MDFENEIVTHTEFKKSLEVVTTLLTNKYGTTLTEGANNALARHAEWIDDIVSKHPLFRDSIISAASVDKCRKKLPALRLSELLMQGSNDCRFPIAVDETFAEKKLCELREDLLSTLKRQLDRTKLRI